MLAPSAAQAEPRVSRPVLHRSPLWQTYAVMMAVVLFAALFTSLGLLIVLQRARMIEAEGVNGRLRQLLVQVRATNQRLRLENESGRTRRRVLDAVEGRGLTPLGTDARQAAPRSDVESHRALGDG